MQGICMYLCIAVVSVFTGPHRRQVERRALHFDHHGFKNHQARDVLRSLRGQTSQQHRGAGPDSTFLPSFT